MTTEDKPLDQQIQIVEDMVEEYKLYLNGLGGDFKPRQR